jgi:hypothetical protein
MVTQGALICLKLNWHIYSHFSLQSPLLHPARQLADGEHIMIRVVAKGSREGADHLDVIRYLSSEARRSDAFNISIPVLQEIHHEDWTFITMLRMHRGWYSFRAWFETLAEAFDFIEQLCGVSQRACFSERRRIDCSAHCRGSPTFTIT